VQKQTKQLEAACDLMWLHKKLKQFNFGPLRSRQIDWYRTEQTFDFFEQRFERTESYEGKNLTTETTTYSLRAKVTLTAGFFDELEHLLRTPNLHLPFEVLDRWDLNKTSLIFRIFTAGNNQDDDRKTYSIRPKHMIDFTKNQFVLGHESVLRKHYVLRRYLGSYHIPDKHWTEEIIAKERYVAPAVGSPVHELDFVDSDSSLRF
jgi:hypothetical protein